MKHYLRLISGVAGLPLLYFMLLYGIAHAVQSEFYKQHIFHFCPPTPPLGAQIYFGTAPDAKQAGCSGERLLGSGWSPRESAGAWTLGGTAHIVFPVFGWPMRDVTMHLNGNTYAGMGFAHGIQTITGRIAGRKAGSWRFETGQSPPMMLLTIPADIINRGEAIDLTLTVDPPMNPKVLNIADDDRALGLHLATAIFQ